MCQAGKGKVGDGRVRELRGKKNKYIIDVDKSKFMESKCFEVALAFFIWKKVS